jgi:diguanylate cyclase (GGDEF)-like protein
MRPGDSPQTRLGSLNGFDCTTSQFDMGSGSFWLRLVPETSEPGFAALPSDLNVLSFVPGWQRGAAIYVRHNDGSISQMALSNRTLSHLTHVGARVQLRLHMRSLRPEAILLRLDDATNHNGLIFRPALSSVAASNRNELIEAAFYCTFAGVCLALLVFNLALLGSMREGFQVAYCLMVIGMLIYAWSYSGGWSLWFPDRDITERFRLAGISRGLTTALAMRFFIEFLEPGMVPPLLRRMATATRLVMLILAASMVVVTLPMVRTVTQITVVTLSIIYALTFIIGVIALIRGSRAARVLCLTWVVTSLAGVARVAEINGAIHHNLLIDHSVLLTMGVNALLFALAIGMRVKILADERDDARDGERLAKRLADIDPLTGLLNRRGLLAQAVRDGARGPLRLMIVDVDHFKSINDNHGHDMGDDVLRDLARVLARRCGRRGHVSRLGGEEFAVIGPAGELSPALALAILADVRQYRFARGISVTVSIGIAEGIIHPGAQGEADWSALYRRADTALYEAKTTGRNRVVDAALMETTGAGALGTVPPVASHDQNRSVRS